jgi:hypothetical protein
MLRNLRRIWRTAVVVSAVIGVQIAPGLVADATPSAAGGPTGAEQVTWSTVSPAASPPPLRSAAVAYDAANQTVVLFGGILADGSLSPNTWVWDGTSWSEHPAATTSSPSARSGASMAFDATARPYPQLILFGGRDASGMPLQDTWAWNGASWNPIFPTSSPGARFGAAMAYDGHGNLILFGGTTTGASAATAGAVSSPGPSGTTSASTLSPSTVADPGSSQSTSGTPPSSAQTSAGQASGAQPGDSPTTMDDTWSWDGTTWTLLNPAASPPSRTGAAIADAGAHSRIVLFGGSASADGRSPLADTWTWVGTTWQRQAPAMSPPARSGAISALDTDLGRTVLAGGSGTTGALADTWLWDGTSWSPSSATVPAARSGAADAYDAATRQLVVLGGSGRGGTTLGDTVILTSAAPVSLRPSSSGSSTSTSAPSGSAGGLTTTGTPGGSGAATTRGGSNPGATTGTQTTVNQATVVNGAATVRQGSLVILTGAGFAPRAMITITFHSTPITVGRTMADIDGRFSVTVAVPNRVAPGEHHFEAVGAALGGGLNTVVTPVRVVLPGSSGPTSATTAILVGVAIAVPFLTWAILGTAGRLRQSRRAAAGGAM